MIRALVFNFRHSFKGEKREVSGLASLSKPDTLLFSLGLFHLGYTQKNANAWL